MGRYVGPAVVEWREGRSEHEFEVGCHAESRADRKSAGGNWEGYLIDRVGLLAKVTRVTDTVTLRTPDWVAEVTFQAPPPPSPFGTVPGERVPPRATRFSGSGKAPF
jgi:hypothetical protein